MTTESICSDEGTRSEEDVVRRGGTVGGMEIEICFYGTKRMSLGALYTIEIVRRIRGVKI